MIIEDIATNTSGIYAITNTINSKIYIGESLDVKKRLQKHFNDLKNNKHSNVLLQLDYNKYGEETFKYSLITETEPILLRKAEMYYIIKYNSSTPLYGYNNAYGDNLSREEKESVFKYIYKDYKDTISCGKLNTPYDIQSTPEQERAWEEYRKKALYEHCMKF